MFVKDMERVDRHGKQTITLLWKEYSAKCRFYYEMNMYNLILGLHALLVVPGPNQNQTGSINVNKTRKVSVSSKYTEVNERGCSDWSIHFPIFKMTFEWRITITVYFHRHALEIFPHLIR
jgi:hypothetical protein